MKIDMLYNEYYEPIAPLILDDESEKQLSQKAKQKTKPKNKKSEETGHNLGSNEEADNPQIKH